MTRQPAPILLTRAPVHSDEWFAAREKGIGGSEIASVLNLGRWTSAYALWWRKKGVVPPEPGNARTDRGHVLEPALLAELARRHPELHWRNTPNQIYAHGLFPWQRASADALGYPTRRARRAKRIGEAKTDADGWRWGPDGSDEIPVDYRAQVVWTIDVHGAEAAHVIVLDGSLRIREYEVPAEPDTAAYMRDRARVFLDSLAGDAPPVDASDSTYQVLRQLHPEIVDRDHEVSFDLACEYVAAVTAYRAAETRKQAATNRLADEMGDARRARVGFPPRSIATRQSRNGGKPFIKASDRLPDLEPPILSAGSVPDLDPLDHDAAAEILAAFRALPPLPTGVAS